MAGGCLKALNSSSYRVYSTRVHWKLHGTWFQKTRILIPVHRRMALCTCPSPPYKRTRQSACSEKCIEETHLSPRKTCENPALLPNFLLKMCVCSFLQLLFPAKLSLISFIPHHVFVWGGGERQTVIFLGPNCA